MTIKNVRKQLKKLFGPQAANVYLVGGLVRDHLRGVKSNDIDLVFRFCPTLIEKLGFTRVQSVSAAPVWILHHQVLGKIEAALPRREVKTGIGYNGFSYETGPEVTLEEDLHRRDFRCNAIAMDLEGQIIDPLFGELDLQTKTLVACSNRAFIEDPLRILRAFRFVADGWNISPGLEKVIREHDWTHELAALPVERKLAEMIKALEKSQPAAFFRCLADFGLDRDAFGEIHAMIGIPAGPPQHRPELFTHACEVLEYVAARSDCPVARLAAFFHDLGKIETHTEDDRFRHIGHEKAGALVVEKILRRLKAPNELRNSVKAVVLAHTKAQRWGELKSGKRVALAEYALKNGVVEPLRLVAEANGANLDGYELALDIAMLKSEELGLDPKLYSGCQKCGCQDPDCRLKKRGGPVIGKDRAQLLRARKGELLSNIRRQPAVTSLAQELVDAVKLLCSAELALIEAVSNTLLPHFEKIPELRALVGLQQDPQHHPEGSVEIHSLLATAWMLAATKGNAARFELVMAALLHDCGKTGTTAEVDGKIVSFGHAEAGDPVICELLANTTVDSASLEKIVSLCHHHMRYLTVDTISTSGINRLTRTLAPASPEELRLIMLADLHSRGSKAPDQETVAAVETLTARLVSARDSVVKKAAEPTPLITAKDLLALSIERREALGIAKPGPRFGELLGQALELQKQGLTATDILSRLE